VKDGTDHPPGNPVRDPSKSYIVSLKGISHLIILVTEDSFSTFNPLTEYLAFPAKVEGAKKQCEQVLNAAILVPFVAS